MKKFFVFMLCSCAVLISASSVYSAAVSINENFDKVKPGALPAEWKAKAEENTTVAVVDKSAVAPLSKPNCLKISDDSTSDVPSFNKSFKEITKGTVKAAVYIPSKNPGEINISMNNSGARVFDIVVSLAGSVKYRFKSQEQKALNKFSQDTWHKIECSWDGSAGTVVVTINGEKAAEVPAEKGFTIDGISLKTGAKAKSGQTAFFDDLSVIGD